MAFNKSLGQNFLIDSEVLERIVDGVQPSDSILEVGAGLGVLTGRLLEITPEVTAIEFDRKLAKYLEKNTSAKIIHEDVLKCDLAGIVAENSVNKIIANLPYYITSPIIMRILEELRTADGRPYIDSAKLMVQYEVAKRIVAKEGSKDYGILSIACQYYADCELLFKVPSSSFLPAPKVDSAVVELKIRKMQTPAGDAGTPFEKGALVKSDKDDFFRLVKAAFAQRRKTFVNSVSNTLGVEKAALEGHLKKIGRPANIRAEQLSIEEFDRLAEFLF